MTRDESDPTRRSDLREEFRFHVECERFEEAWQNNQAPRIEEYLEGWQEPQRKELFRELMLVECELLNAEGHQPSVESWTTRFPEYADRIGKLIEEMASSSQEDQPKQPALDQEQTIAAPTIGEKLGQTIGHYKLMEQIGEGGMGVVYVAQQEKPVRRRVALKVIKPGMDSKEVLARFGAERQALALMEHPNIARVLDAGATDSGRPFFVMELVRGIPITEFCDKNRLTAKERLQIFINVCHAIQHAHQKGIIHRDIKPGNVLVTSQDGKPLVKVIDFGVAKAINQKLTEDTVYTHFAQMLGTPLYMSPEQAEMSVQDVDTRSDIYSLGVLLYELLTGRPTIDNDRIRKVTYDELRRIIREDEPSKPSDKISTLGKAASSVSVDRSTDPRRLSQLLRDELDWIVMTALEKDRDRRYESASAFAVDIERYLKDEPVEACPRSTTYRFKKFARRHSKTLTTALLLVLTVLVGAGVSIWQAVDAIDARQKAENSERLADQRFVEADKQRRSAVWATKQAQLNEEISRQLVYAADVKLAGQAWKSGDIRRFTDLLDRHIPIAGKKDRRGFEWWYLRQFGKAHFRNIATQTGGSCVVRFSPDGVYLVTGRCDGTICVWNGRSYDRYATLPGHEGLVRGIDFAPDGRRMASIGDDGMIRLWDLSERKQVRSFQAHAGHGFRVFFVADGKTLASCGKDTAVRFWNASTGESVGKLDGAARTVERAAMDRSPDGRLFVSADPVGYVRVWDVQTHKRICKLDLGTLEGLHRHLGCCASFSPDGRYVAVGTDLHVIRLCDARTGKQIETFTGHEDDIQAVTFHPSGRLLASSDMAGVIRLWPIKSLGNAEAGDDDLDGTNIWPPYFQGHSSRGWSLDFSPDGTRLISASKDGNVRSWSGREQTTHKIKGTADADAAMFVPDGSELLFAGDNNIRIWNRQANDNRKFSTLFKEEALCAAVSPDGETCVSGHKQGLIRFWSRENGRLERTLTAHEDSVDQIVFSLDGRMLATASWDGTAKLWDALSGKQIAVFDTQRPHCYDVAISPDGTRLACSSEDDAMIYDVASRKRLHLLRGHLNSARRVAFSPDGQLLATGSDDRTIRIWDVASGEVKRIIAAHHNAIHSLAFSPDGRTIASGDKRGTIVFSHADTGRILFDTKIGFSKVLSLQFSPDGETLAATVSDEGVILLHAPRAEAKDLENAGHAQPLKKFPRENDERAEFFGLGLLPDGYSDSYASHISADGSVVIGYCQDGTKKKTFRWKEETGMRELPAWQGFTNGLIDDGSILYGRKKSSGIIKATVWTSLTEYVFLPHPPGPPKHAECEAASVDGSILAGWCTDASGNRQALRWTAEGVKVLEGSGAQYKTTANAISASGEIIVGTEWTGARSSSPDTRRRPVRWTPSGVERLSGFDPVYNWFVDDISSDGSVIVGMRWMAGTVGPWTGATDLMAFRWENGTVTPLGNLAGGDIYSIAHSVSADGRIVVGYFKDVGRTFAFVWDAAHGMRSLESVLRRYGVVLQGWRLHIAHSVSGDGRSIVGWGLRKNGRKEAWLARLPKQAFAVESKNSD